MIKSKTALLHKKCAIKFVFEYIILLAMNDKRLSNIMRRKRTDL